MADLKRILLVEDNANDVELTLIALEENNLANQVMVVRDGAEALDYLYARGAYLGRQSELPIVVFLDIKLPKIDGLEVLKTMKSDPQLKLIPVVMITSSNEQQDLMTSYGSGANAYVVKPIKFEDFVSTVKELGLFWAVINSTLPIKKTE